ncbi:MAG: hypothetical protein H8E13_12190 [Actinobacteria bacterium]|nr:hypothetical protein [Actinomycetota bacterium]
MGFTNKLPGKHTSLGMLNKGIVDFDKKLIINGLKETKKTCDKLITFVNKMNWDKI